MLATNLESSIFRLEGCSNECATLFGLYSGAKSYLYGYLHVRLLSWDIWVVSNENTHWFQKGTFKFHKLAPFYCTTFCAKCVQIVVSQNGIKVTHFQGRIIQLHHMRVKRLFRVWIHWTYKGNAVAVSFFWLDTNNSYFIQVFSSSRNNIRMTV